MKADMLRRFQGREIATAIVEAVEAIPEGAEIVEFKAGENMPVTCSYIFDPETDDRYTGNFDEFAWNGETWHHIGWL